MCSIQTMDGHASHRPDTAPVDQKLEVVIIPVSDVDQANDWRLVQMTPPGSPCSVMFGRRVTSAVPGSLQGAFLVVDDLETARNELGRRGVEVSEVFHFQADLLNARAVGYVPGRHPKGRSYFSFVSFNDPDGNGWLLQEVTARFPGRGFSSDVTTLTELLRETEKRHGGYEPTAPKHHWSEWYAAYIVARERGRTPDDATADAAGNVERRRTVLRA